MESMSFAVVGRRLVGAVAMVSTVLAGATIWLLVTDPGTVTSALAEGSVEPLLRELMEVVGTALRHLLRWV
jgi:hypothetical protein